MLVGLMVTSLNFAGHCRVILSMSAPSTAHMQLNLEAPLETMHVQGLKKAKQCITSLHRGFHFILRGQT